MYICMVNVYSTQSYIRVILSLDTFTCVCTRVCDYHNTVHSNTTLTMAEPMEWLDLEPLWIYISQV